MGYAGYAPGHKVVELTVLQQLLKLIKSDKSLETLEKLTRNTAQAPAEEKFRKVRRGSAIASTASTRARPRIPANRPPAERNGTVATRPRVSGREETLTRRSTWTPTRARLFFANANVVTDLA